MQQVFHTIGSAALMRQALEKIAAMDGRTVPALRTNEGYAHGAEDAFAEVAGIAQRTLEAVGE